MTLLLGLMFLVGCGTAPPSKIPVTPEPYLRETVYLDQTELHTMPDQPGVVFLRMTGQVPTACHQASTTVCPACSTTYGHLIQLNLYAMIENGRVCDKPPTPFMQDVPLGTYSEGVYVVTLNGQYIGAFDAQSLDTPVEMTQEPVKLNAINLVPPGPNNSPARLIVQGDMPSPCHVFKSEIQFAGQSEILVKAYSLVWPEESCSSGTQNFSSEVSLGALASGEYTIWVNEKSVGSVEVP